MTPTAKVLEILVDGTPKGKLHFNLVGKIKLTRIRLEEEFNKDVKNRNLLNKNADYSLMGFEKYKEILKNYVGKIYQNQNIEVNEVNLGKFKKLYNKYGLKQAPFK